MNLGDIFDEYLRKRRDTMTDEQRRTENVIDRDQDYLLASMRAESCKEMIFRARAKIMDRLAEKEAYQESMKELVSACDSSVKVIPNLRHHKGHMQMIAHRKIIYKTLCDDINEMHRQLKIIEWVK